MKKFNFKQNEEEFVMIIEEFRVREPGRFKFLKNSSNMEKKVMTMF